MRGGRKEIAHEEGRLARILKQDCLVEGHVSRREADRDSGEHLLIAVQQPPAIGGGDGLEVGCQIAGPGAFIGVLQLWYTFDDNFLAHSHGRSQ